MPSDNSTVDVYLTPLELRKWVKEGIILPSARAKIEQAAARLEAYPDDDMEVHLDIDLN